MKKTFLIIAFLIGGISLTKAQIQPDPAHWAYGLKRLTGNMYEIHLQCAIDDGWHIYAQKQTKDFIGTKTKIALYKTPRVIIIGTPVEIGKKDKFVAQEVNIINYEYAGKVDFVQKGTIKPDIKEIKGTITYQTCTHKECLPEKMISFTVPVQ